MSLNAFTEMCAPQGKIAATVKSVLLAAIGNKLPSNLHTTIKVRFR
jgi:hypothetical protein